MEFGMIAQWASSFGFLREKLWSRWCSNNLRFARPMVLRAWGKGDGIGVALPIALSTSALSSSQPLITLRMSRALPGSLVALFPTLYRFYP